MMGRALFLLLCACGSSGSAVNTEPLALDFAPIEVEGGIELATELRFIPGGDELLVGGKDGRVAHLRLTGDAAERLGEFEVPGVHSDFDCGLISLALDPDFADNRYLYAGTCTSMTHSAIVRLTFQPDDYPAIADSAVEILAAGDPEADRPWHNIGALGFDATGAMWALLGDKRVAANGQDLDDDLGAVVRILPSRDPEAGGHAPAPDNPFADQPGRDADVYAYGLRSPWRGALDAAGRLWVADVGANGVEEVNLITAPGANFGWSDAEGPCTGDCGGKTDPVTWWPHDDVTIPYVLEDPEVRPSPGRVGWVGLEHRPADADPYEGRLAGRMLFGDFCLGFVRELAVAEDGSVLGDRHLGNLPNPSSWDQGPDGFVYATTFGSCTTMTIDPDDPPPSGLWRAIPVPAPAAE